MSLSEIRDQKSLKTNFPPKTHKLFRALAIVFSFFDADIYFAPNYLHLHNSTKINPELELLIFAENEGNQSAILSILRQLFYLFTMCCLLSSKFFIRMETKFHSMLLFATNTQLNISN